MSLIAMENLTRVDREKSLIVNASSTLPESERGHIILFKRARKRLSKRKRNGVRNDLARFGAHVTINVGSM